MPISKDAAYRISERLKENEDIPLSALVSDIEKEVFIENARAAFTKFRKTSDVDFDRMLREPNGIVTIVKFLAERVNDAAFNAGGLPVSQPKDIVNMLIGDEIVSGLDDDGTANINQKALEARMFGRTDGEHADALNKGWLQNALANAGTIKRGQSSKHKGGK